ncbi:hypothetical protein AJ79_08311 [Helicocarpus griseus UAMH5409]|uniref:Uncharacterized protein n=1 Tax=Helicocarpus griseus UAMH5409 TaxID=1447875 RepID=A0A2B7WUJ5_9EURO|nr:hypothetical protein AJ79_08311 [Helicocarpus griseus UAMH5409]
MAENALAVPLAIPEPQLGVNTWFEHVVLKEEDSIHFSFVYQRIRFVASVSKDHPDPLFNRFVGRLRLWYKICDPVFGKAGRHSDESYSTLVNEVWDLLSPPLVQSGLIREREGLATLEEMLLLPTVVCVGEFRRHWGARPPLTQMTEWTAWHAMAVKFQQKFVDFEDVLHDLNGTVTIIPAKNICIHDDFGKLSFCRVGWNGDTAIFQSRNHHEWLRNACYLYYKVAGVQREIQKSSPGTLYAGIQQILGIVTSRRKFAGVLLKDLEGRRLARWNGIQEETPRRMRKRWAEQVRNTVLLLHDNGLTWEAAGLGNVFIDQETNDACLIDWSGIWTGNLSPEMLKTVRQWDFSHLEAVYKFLGEETFTMEKS